MLNKLYAGTAAVALLAGAAHAGGHLMVNPGEGDFNWDSYNAFADANDYTGQQLTIFGPWLGPDAEALENVLNYFREATGADVRYTGSDSFEQQMAEFNKDFTSDIRPHIESHYRIKPGRASRAIAGSRAVNAASLTNRERTASSVSSSRMRTTSWSIATTPSTLWAL